MATSLLVGQRDKKRWTECDNGLKTAAAGRSDGTELDSSIPNLLPILGSNSSNYVSTEPGDFY